VGTNASTALAYEGVDDTTVSDVTPKALDTCAALSDVKLAAELMMASIVSLVPSK